MRGHSGSVVESFAVILVAKKANEASNPADSGPWISTRRKFLSLYILSLEKN